MDFRQKQDCFKSDTQTTVTRRSRFFEVPSSCLDMDDLKNINSSSRISNQCKVCGAEGRCVNYGAFTCQACRAFFRRHGLSAKVIPACPNGNRCKTNYLENKKYICIACRLAKCISVGMRPYFTQKSQSKCDAHKGEQEQRTYDRSIELKLPTVFSLDLLEKDRSNLTESQWRLLSNIIHAYDKFSLIPTIIDLLQSDFMSPNLTTIRANRIVLDISENQIASILLLIRSIPDFQILTLQEKMALTKRNLKGLVGISFLLLNRDSCLLNYQNYLNATISIFGKYTMTRTQQLQAHLDTNSNLIKIFTMIVALSSSAYMVDEISTPQDDPFLFGTFHLYGSQNIYLDLLWNYMVYRYGEHETIQRFAKLVFEFMNLFHLTPNVYGNSCLFKDQLNNTVDLVSRRLVDSHEHTLLWGII